MIQNWFLFKRIFKVNSFYLKIFFIFFCFFFSYGELSAENQSFSVPWKTELVKEDINKAENSISGILKYKSMLSKKKIINFYSNYFHRKGFSQITNDSLDSRSFTRGPDRRSLHFVSSSKEYTNYIIGFYNLNENIKKNIKERIRKNKKLKNIINNLFPSVMEKTNKLDFMPMHEGLSQLKYERYVNSTPPLIAIGYLSRSNSEEIINFYLNHMPSFGWELLDRDIHNGSYRISGWCPMVAPFSVFCTTLAKPLSRRLPPLQVQGETLTFIKPGEKCLITVHTFEDIVQKALQYRYDLSLMEQYGTTVVGVSYFY